VAHDSTTQQTEAAGLDAARARRAANLFDLRRIIGGLFAVYGVILVILGLGASDAEIDKAAGWNLNLWVGLAMLVVAAIFLLWAFTRPLGDELAAGEASEGDGTARDEPARAGSGPGAAAASETTRGRARRDDGGAGG
jgi:hypothetical protein